MRFTKLFFFVAIGLKAQMDNNPKSLDYILSILGGETTYSHTLPEGVDPNSDTLTYPGIPMLNLILRRRDFVAARKLVERYGANVNIQEWRTSKVTASGISGVSPLMCCVAAQGPFKPGEFTEAKDTAQFLLEKGADPNLTDGNGWNALRYVVNNNKISEDQKIVWLNLLKRHGIKEGGSVNMAKSIDLDRIQPNFFLELTRLKTGNEEEETC